MSIFFKGDMCTLYLLLCIHGGFVLSFPRSAIGGWWWWAGVCGQLRCLGGVGWLWEPWCSYLNRFSPAPSSHWGLCKLIQCAGTQYPHMQRWVARTKVIAILLLIYTHVLE